MEIPFGPSPYPALPPASATHTFQRLARLGALGHATLSSAANWMSGAHIARGGGGRQGQQSPPLRAIEPFVHPLTRLAAAPLCPRSPHCGLGLSWPPRARCARRALPAAVARTKPGTQPLEERCRDPRLQQAPSRGRCSVRAFAAYGRHGSRRPGAARCARCRPRNASAFAVHLPQRRCPRLPQVHGEAQGLRLEQCCGHRARSYATDAGVRQPAGDGARPHSD